MVPGGLSGSPLSGVARIREVLEVVITSCNVGKTRINHPPR